MDDTEETEELILASSSPRRRELLGKLGVRFIVDAPDVDETCSLLPKFAVQEISRRKAMACAKKHTGKIILAADTLVALDEVPFGKPHSSENAAEMLKLLSGRTHQVHTGVTVIDKSGDVHTSVTTTDVHFIHVSDEEIADYVATGEPMDKAGAYAIQGGAGKWIDNVTGSFSNVIGLPLETVSEMLAECGMKLGKNTEKLG